METAAMAAIIRKAISLAFISESPFSWCTAEQKKRVSAICEGIAGYRISAFGCQNIYAIDQAYVNNEPVGQKAIKRLTSLFSVQQQLAHLRRLAHGLISAGVSQYMAISGPGQLQFLILKYCSSSTIPGNPSPQPLPVMKYRR
jgi:hypothetical protein